MTKSITSPAVLPANEKQQYEKPSFEVINLHMESPLLAGSSVPTTINPIQRNPEE